MKISRIMLALGLAVGLMTPVAAQGAGDYAISISPRTENINAGQNLTVKTENLPAGQGIYALLCKAADSAETYPTICDQSQALWIIGSVPQMPGQFQNSGVLVAKASFEGKASRQSPVGTMVDCRVDDCVVFIRPDHLSMANPALYSIRPLTLLPASADGMTDYAAIRFNGSAVVTNSPALGYKQTVKLGFTTDSGLKVAPSVTGTNCKLNGYKLTALSSEGECVVTAFTKGNENFAPLAQEIVITLQPAAQSIAVNWPAASAEVGETASFKLSDVKLAYPATVKVKSLNPAKCAVEKSGKSFNINFKAAGECEIKVTATKTKAVGAVSASQIFSVTK